jgi:hypothetical protein
VDSSTELLFAQKVLSEGLAGSVRFELAKKSEEGAYAAGLRLLAPWMIQAIQEQCKIIGIENRANERQATASHVPYYRKPQLMHDCFELIFGEGCWQDEDFVEDTLKHHPELRCKVKYGIHGQEYVHG